MTKDEALKMALEALCVAVEPKKGKVYAREFEPIDCFAMHEQAITAIKEALAQPEQEPVAYYHPHKGFYWAKPTRISAPTAVDVKPLPLYTAPQREWVGLTDAEVQNIVYCRSPNIANLRKAEQLLKEKNK